MSWVSLNASIKTGLMKTTVRYPELERMHSSHKVYMLDRSSAALKSQYLNAKHTVQKRLSQMKNTRWAKKARELQEAADKITPGSSTKAFEPFTDPGQVAAHLQMVNTPYRQAGYPKPLGRTIQCPPESAIFSLPGSSRCDSSEANI